MDRLVNEPAPYPHHAVPRIVHRLGRYLGRLCTPRAPARRAVAITVLLATALLACGDNAKLKIPPSSEQEIRSFAFLAAQNFGLTSDVTATINGTAITATVPFGTNPHALIATFTTTGASVTVAGVPQTSGANHNDFAAPVVYRVTAEDGSTSDYTATVSVALSPSKEITAMSFRAADNGALGVDITATISDTSIAATVPFGTNVTALVATFTTTGDDVTVNGISQATGASHQDFTHPVVYRVTALDGSTRDYTVTVTIAPSSAKNLITLLFVATNNPRLSTTVIATITGTTVTATLPFGPDIHALVASFSISGATASVGGVLQNSGVTANDFSSPVVYRITAADGTTKDYTVTITIAPAPKDITDFSFAMGQNPGLAINVFARINGTAITAVVPAGTSVTSLVASFVTTGASITVGGVMQQSGTTHNNFTSPVIYRVTGADNLTKDYTVVVVPEVYIKASNTGASDEFGFNVALSADGSTLAVGAIAEDGGPGGNPADNSAPNAGAVYIFVRSGASWVQQAYLKASNAEMNDNFGYSVALSADGSVLAVGSINESSGATGIDGNQADNSVAAAGAVYLFGRSGTTWTQQHYIKASNPGIGDQFGLAVAFSADATTLAVGAPGEDSGSIGVNGDQGNSDTLFNSGAAYVFVLSGGTWSQEAYIKASNTGRDDIFGFSIALSADGSTLAVGAIDEDGGATGINGPTNIFITLAGAAYVYVRTGTTWAQQAYVKASNTGQLDQFGASVALSADGNTLAVGALGEASGITTNQNDNSSPNAGAVYVFTRSGTTWTQQAYIKSDRPTPDDFFGRSVALSSDGSTLAVGADRADIDSGTIFTFTRSATTWNPRLHLDATNPGLGDRLGAEIALSGDGATLAAGAAFEDSSATGIGGNQNNETAVDSGTVYIFH